MATTREQGLMPHGIPRYIRVYDNGRDTLDRYTILFTGRYKDRPRGSICYVSASQTGAGVYMHGEMENAPWGSYSHLGTPIGFTDLSPELQQLIIADYKAYWEL